MGQVRTALLIGIGHVPAADGVFEPLDTVVEADLRLLSSALDAAGYAVETLHNAGRSQIRTRIFEVARGVPADGTLLLYFSGHGVRVGTTDYLVPYDATPPGDGDWQGPYVDSLLPAAISPMLETCTAGTVLWVIDACRTDLSGGGAAFGASTDNGPPAGGYAVMTGCSAGERSGYTDEGSFFTRGLAEALGPLTPARSVHEVFAAAHAKALRAARRHGRSQNADIRYGTHEESRTRETEICEGRPLLDAWRDAVRDTPLWERVEERDAASVPRFQECLGAFVEECARTLHLAQGRLPHADPWADDAFAVRLLRDRLPLLVAPSARLSAVEAATLVAAPFLHEAAWAARLSQAAEIDPYVLDRRAGGDAHRRHYEQIADQHARVARKLAQCRAHDRAEDTVAVTMWLVHRWIADRFDTDDTAVPASAADALAAALLGSRLATPDRVRELSGLLCTAAAAIGLDEVPDDLHALAPGKVLLPEGHQALRVRPLAALLRLGAVLAVDARTFPEVVAEHLAVTDPVLPQHVVGIAHSMSWEHDGDTLHLDAVCPHQAVHAALTEITDQADRLAEEATGLAAGLPEAEAALLAAVPTRVTARGLRPSRAGAHPSYEVPLLRFHLAQTEVRELLMGEQLYGGEPHLALRELYQNAMDACRYRAMRWAYLHSSGAGPAPWTGGISLIQGEDARGRYVECRDNGVGMSAEHLKYTFTRAGSRFEQSKAFRREQSRWLRHDPGLRLYPNSRFGIGVFSYFMLAEEMTIVTRQVSPEGFPAEHALRVDIPSSGSLFRIQRHDGTDDGLPEGGTRVRLYLREGALADGLSCVNTLRGLVRISEFDLDVRDASGHAHRWPAGALQSAPGTDAVAPLEAVPGVLWWVSDEGAVLADGITTDEKPFGYVLNLTGPHAGRLSVSRKELQGFDRTWAEENWRKGAKALTEWPGLTMEWLWSLDRVERDVARVLWEEWRGTGVRVGRREVRETHALDDTGVFHLDGTVVRNTSHRPHSPERRLFPWRVAALRQTHGVPALAPPASLVGHPLAQPGDAELSDKVERSWRSVVAYAAKHRMTVAEVLRRKRALRIVHPFEGPPAVAEGDLDWVPDELDGELAGLLSGTFRGRPVATVQGAADSRDLGGLVVGSHLLAVPLGVLARRCARFAPLLPHPIPLAPAHHEDHVCTEEDMTRLFGSKRAYTQRLNRVGALRGIRQVCLATGTDPAALLRLIDDFSWLGWTAPPVDEVAKWLALDEEIHEVLTLFTSPLPDGRLMLHWAATLDLADTWDIALEEAERELGPVAAELDLVYETRYAGGSDTGTLVPSLKTAQFLRDLASVGRHLETGLDFEGLALAYSQKAHVGHEDLAAVVAELRLAGVSSPGDTSIISEWEDLALRSRYVLSGGKDVLSDEENLPTAELTTASLFSAAVALQEPLSEVWDIAERDGLRFGLTVPDLPDPLSGYRPTVHDGILTTQPSDSYGNYSAHVWKSLTPHALARYAHNLGTDAATALERLASLRRIGALVPELAPPDLEALRTCVPDERDLVALSEEHRLSPPDEAPGPLDLVSVAARLGEPVPVTLGRLAPYLPLWPSSRPLPDPPDTVPLWQDLALLTEHLDGRLPAVEGEVTRRHIAHAARGTGASEAWIGSRLRLYSSLFGLRTDTPTRDTADDRSTHRVP
ncbi:peptidase C14 caspase catalytic subunit p20 [Streptomyces sp. p1417]|uniref:Peptidase C14 caspase catalytic subunit p20 n=1 Tax=Streptomyces typhae TaxID=2681492 RepID=A0A6L6X1V1_9ACTN|nr:caspase family protein [Streptomyces typhae]MVO87579.1 peptidase C14 caspase catalytic subunit p20 [Streptomyces typhae]